MNRQTQYSDKHAKFQRLSLNCLPKIQWTHFLTNPTTYLLQSDHYVTKFFCAKQAHFKSGVKVFGSKSILFDLSLRFAFPPWGCLTVQIFLTKCQITFQNIALHSRYFNFKKRKEDSLTRITVFCVNVSVNMSLKASY